VNSGEHQGTVWDRVRPSSLPEWRKTSRKPPAGIDGSGFGALGTPARTAQLQPLRGLSRRASRQTPSRVRPSRAPARTRVATRGQSAPHAWPPSPRKSPRISGAAALIAERRSRLGWGRPVLRSRRVLLPGARRSRSSGIGCPGRLLASRQSAPFRSCRRPPLPGDRALSGNSRLAGTRRNVTRAVGSSTG
jgi:hypothetical protein